MQFNIGDAKVVNSRYFKSQNTIWRRRKTASGTVFTTRERIDLSGRIVRKTSSKSTEGYQPVKLLQSLINTLSHREDVLQAAWALLDNVENQLLQNIDNLKAEISTELIARTVLDILKSFDLDGFLTYARYHPELVSKSELQEVLSK